MHGHGRAARLVARGLRALAHRGGRAAGLVAVPGDVRARREAHDAFLDDEPALEALRGDLAIGCRHGRETSPDAPVGLVDAVRLPRVATVAGQPVAVAVAGGFAAPARLRRELAEQGVALGPPTPDELLLHLIARSRQRTLVNRVVDALWRAPGGYGVLVAAPGVLVAVRDPQGLRPLLLGRVDGATVVATEEAALVAMGAVTLRALLPGEMLIVDDRGQASVEPFGRRTVAPCAQELAQLAAGTSQLHGASAWEARTRLGEELGYAAPAAIDVVVAAGAAALPAAHAFAAVLQKPVVPALGGHTAVPELVAGRRVALVDLAPGEDLRGAVGALTAAGAAAVHVRGAVPRRQRACPYGVDGRELVVGEAPEAWATRLGATSVAWLPAERLGVALGEVGLPAGACTACVGGALPLPPEGEADQLPLFAAEGDEA
ncbi:MAG: hypothetical protein H6732_20405 [Alphaproteobacteria bacterium]|nr:hypothetical protein [Alphaproteobacteria bacterium]